jgi:hypothetical protein
MQNNKLKQQNSPAGHAAVNLDLQVPGNFQHWPLFSLDPAAWNWIQSLFRISATIPCYVCVGWWQLSGSQQHDPTSYQDVIEHNILYL